MLPIIKTLLWPIYKFPEQAVKINGFDEIFMCNSIEGMKYNRIPSLSAKSKGAAFLNITYYYTSNETLDWGLCLLA